MVVAPLRAGGQAQFIDPMELDHRTEGPLGDLLAWMVANLDREITVGHLAARLNISRGTFDRQFHAVTGTSPLRWLLHHRVIVAQQHLETTDLPIDQVARSVGFTNAVSMRPHFHQTVGISPLQYRQAFGGRGRTPPGHVGGNASITLAAALKALASRPLGSLWPRRPA